MIVTCSNDMQIVFPLTGSYSRWIQMCSNREIRRNCRFVCRTAKGCKSWRSAHRVGLYCATIDVLQRWDRSGWRRPGGMPCVVCREVVVDAVCATVHATDDCLRWASSHCARTPATANGDLAQPPDPTLAQPKPAQRTCHRCKLFRQGISMSSAVRMYLCSLGLFCLSLGSFAAFWL